MLAEVAGVLPCDGWRSHCRMGAVHRAVQRRQAGCPGCPGLGGCRGRGCLLIAIARAGSGCGACSRTRASPSSNVPCSRPDNSKAVGSLEGQKGSRLHGWSLGLSNACWRGRAYCHHATAIETR
jgi:hypothetical protein